jgi:hypothetical protein
MPVTAAISPQRLAVLRAQFEAGQQLYPGLQHVVANTPGYEARITLPDWLPDYIYPCLDEENLQTVGVERLAADPPLRAGWSVYHWLLRPPGVSWDMAEAYYHLRPLAELAGESLGALGSIPVAYDRWLFWLHQSCPRRTITWMCSTATGDAPLHLTARPPGALPEEAYVVELEDVFFASGIALADMAAAVEESARKKPSRGKDDPELLRKLAEARKELGQDVSREAVVRHVGVRDKDGYAGLRKLEGKARGGKKAA